MSNKKALKQMFETNTDENEIHTTSDGQHFWKRNHAEAHASGLTNKSITMTTRDQAMIVESDEEALEAIENRKKEIMSIVDSYRPEFDELEAKEAEIKERLNKAKEIKAEELEEEETGDKTGKGTADKGQSKGGKGSTKSGKK